MKIYSVKGNDFKLDGGAMFGHVPKTIWKNWIKPDKDNRIQLASRSLYIETKNHNILFETGIGNFFEQKLADRYGVDTSENQLIKNLNTIGVKETDIDYVILSHLHFDHAGGLVSQQNNLELHFPNAKYIVGYYHFQRAKNPHERDKSSFIKGLTDSLEKSNRLILADDETIDELEGIVSFYYSEGHTPGQLHSLIHKNEENIFFVGDLMPGTAWINLPVTMGFDRAPEGLIEEKKMILEWAFQEKWTIFYTHDPVVAVSKISKDENKRYKAVDTKGLLIG